MNLVDWSHSTYGPHLLLGLSLVYSIVVGVLANRFRNSRHWLLALAVTAPIPVLIISGQHLPLIDHLSPRFFCFGDPSIIQFIAILAPAIGPIGYFVKRSQVAGVGA